MTPEGKKLCSKCGEEKPLTSFHKDQHKTSGYCSACKACRSIDKYNYTINNKNKIRASHKNYYEQNKEKILKRISKYQAQNKEKRNALAKRWNKKNPEKYKAGYTRRNKKIRGNPKGRINSRISVYINQSLRGKKAGRRWESLVGYTLADLMIHLEGKFNAGMSWDNIGKWHIDHIIPISAFNFKNTEDIDFKRCWSLKNLQPLWSKDNLSKGNKLIKPFQPTLSFGEI